MAIAGIVRGRPTRVPMGERGFCRAGVATVRQEPHPPGINIAAACLAGIQRAKGLARPQLRQPESCLQKSRCIKLHSQQGTDHFVVSLFPNSTFLCTTHGHSLWGVLFFLLELAIEGTQHSSLLPPFASYRDPLSLTLTIAKKVPCIFSSGIFDQRICGCILS